MIPWNILHAVPNHDMSTPQVVKDVRDQCLSSSSCFFDGSRALAILCDVIIKAHMEVTDYATRDPENRPMEGRM